MEFLSGKCKTDFIKWKQDRYGKDLSLLPAHLENVIQYTFHIEFFDLKGIYIDRNIYDRKINIWNYRESEPSEPIVIDCNYFEYLKEWYIEAFEKANEIYTSRQ